MWPQPLFALFASSLFSIVKGEGLAASAGAFCNLSIPADVDYFRPEYGLRGPHLASKRSHLRNLLNGLRISGVVWYDGFTIKKYDDEYFDQVQAGANFDATDPCQRLICTDLQPHEYPSRYQHCSNAPACNRGETIGGVNFDIMAHLEEKGNFTTVFTLLPKPNSWLVHPDGTELTSIERIQEQSRDFDIALDTWYEADVRRYAGAYFGRGFQDTSMVILSPKPNPYKIDLSIIWEPFSADLWVISAILLGLAIIALSLAEKNVVVQEQKNGDMRYHVMGFDIKSLAIAGESIIEQGPLNPTTTQGRIIREGFKFFVFFAYSIYVANLAAVLVVNHQGNAVYSLNDIQAKSCTVLMRPEEPQRRLLEKKYSYLRVKETSRITSKGEDVSIEEVLIDEKACAAIYPAMLGYKYLSLKKNCDIMLNPIDDSEFKFGGGYMTDSEVETECKPNIFVALNTLLLDMEVNGALNSILLNYSYFETGKDPTTDECYVAEQKEDPNGATSEGDKVTFEQLLSVIIVAFGVIIFCTVYSIFKLIHPTTKIDESNVDWEHQSYPIDWQHQVFKKLLADTYSKEGEGQKEVINSDIGRRRLSCPDGLSTIDYTSLHLQEANNGNNDQRYIMAGTVQPVTGRVV